MANVMELITKQWYNVLATGLNLSPQQFQIVQGTISNISNDAQLWSVFNAIPELSVNSFYSAPAANDFVGNYNNVLVSLNASSDKAFETCMGDAAYKQWQKYYGEHAADLDPFNPSTVYTLFRKWAMVNDPSKVSCGVLLQQLFIDPVAFAISIFAAAQGNNTFAWNRTFGEYRTAIAHGATSHLNFTSSSGDSNISHTWAKKSSTTFFGLFGSSSSSDTLTTKVNAQSLEVDIKIGKWNSFIANPYSQPDPALPAAALPWYYSAAMIKAYQTKGAPVWKDAAPATTWEKSFGANGSFQRMATTIIAGEDISVTIKGKASFSDEDIRKANEDGGKGVWPFYRANDSSGSDNEVKKWGTDGFEITTRIPAGFPQVMGILQTPMSSVFQ